MAIQDDAYRVDDSAPAQPLVTIERLERAISELTTCSAGACLPLDGDGCRVRDVNTGEAVN